MVIENVLKGKDPKGWAITEVVEKGDGAWAKASASGERDIVLSKLAADQFFRVLRSSTAATEPVPRSPAWAGRASVATAFRRSGW